MARKVALALLLAVCSVQLGWASPASLHSRQLDDASNNVTAPESSNSSDTSSSTNPFLEIAKDFQSKLNGFANHFLGTRSVSVRDSGSTSNNTASNSTGKTNAAGSFIKGAVGQFENIFKNPFRGFFGKRAEQYTIGDVFQQLAEEWIKENLQRPVSTRDTSENTTATNSTSSANSTQQDNIIDDAVNGFEEALGNFFGGFFGKRSVSIRDSNSTANSTASNSTSNTGGPGSFIKGAVDQFENIFKHPFGVFFSKRAEQNAIGDVFQQLAEDWVKEKFQRPVSRRDTSDNSTATNSTSNANSTQNGTIFEDAIDGFHDAVGKIFGGLFGKRSNEASIDITPEWANGNIEQSYRDISDNDFTSNDLFTEAFEEWLAENRKRSVSVRDSNSVP